MSRVKLYTNYGPGGTARNLTYSFNVGPHRGIIIRIRKLYPEILFSIRTKSITDYTIHFTFKAPMYETAAQKAADILLDLQLLLNKYMIEDG